MNRIALIVLCPVVLLLLSCGSSDRREVSETRTRPSPEVQKTDIATQLGMPQLAGPVGEPHASRLGQPAGAPRLAYDLPAGWAALAPRPLREINLGVEGASDTECFVSVIPGDGGGLVMNVNRWAGQMGVEELSEDAIAALPRFVMLGTDGVFVEFEGHYTGMRGEADVAHASMLGAMAFLDTHAVFVKFTGPKAVIEAHRQAFAAFCDSLRLDGAPRSASTTAGPPDDPAAAAAAEFAPVGATREFDPGRLSWSAPESWVQSPERAMRVATYTVADSPETECYITVLSSDGGGMAANLNRWRAQMGKASPFTAGEIDLLPRIPMLGSEAVLIALEGDYTGMTGPTHAGYGLRGAVLLLGTHSVFVRMTGPAAIVAREHDNFLAFCESMKHES